MWPRAGDNPDAEVRRPAHLAGRILLDGTGDSGRETAAPEPKCSRLWDLIKARGFRAQKHTVLPSEDAAAFKALEAALIEELAPEGALQSALAQRVVSAVWRLERGERLEADLLAENQLAGWSLGHALIRDGNGAQLRHPAALSRRHAR
jgi:hypothetical protein